ncbi:helix-turn-helix domain-containing protein [Serratia fonticola]|uniref:helix-turn-helix domain-containing protein n=1 Tax=Serratia fonticola TaxID=47917 RepID=UPI00217898CB|nr:Uncharacterised protein [Serratia fonticola]
MSVIFTDLCPSNFIANSFPFSFSYPLRKLVLIKLADNANDQGECWPSVPYIAEQCEVSERSVQNHIQQLVKDGFIRVEIRKAENGLNRSNIYHITLKRGGANAAPRTSHSLEPVNEPIDTGSADADPQEQTADDRMNYQVILDAYHEILPEMAEVRVLTDSRKKTIRNFWKKFKFNQDRWVAYLRYTGVHCRWMLEDRPNGTGRFWKRKNLDYLITDRYYVAVKEERANDR